MQYNTMWKLFSDQGGSSSVVKSEDEAAEKLVTVQGRNSTAENNLGAGAGAVEWTLPRHP